MGRVRLGQRGDLSLTGFPRAQFGTVDVAVERIASEAREGLIRVELLLAAPGRAAVPLQHGLPGAVRIEVERATPLALLLRAVGGALGASGDRPEAPEEEAVSARRDRRRWLAPEAVQASPMDCGPSALWALAAGYRLDVSYGRLREACQTDVDGTATDPHQMERSRTDWRREGVALIDRWQPHELPADVERGLLALMDALGLNYGAADIVVTPEGRHVFLELNPAGEFFWLERENGFPISQALADVLLGTVERREPPLLTGDPRRAG